MCGDPCHGPATVTVRSKREIFFIIRFFFVFRLGVQFFLSVSASSFNSVSLLFRLHQHLGQFSLLHILPYFGNAVLQYNFQVVYFVPFVSVLRSSIHFLLLLAFYAAETVPIQLLSGHNNVSVSQSRRFVAVLLFLYVSSFRLWQLVIFSLFIFFFFISNHVISSKHWSGRKQLILFPSNLNAPREILRLDVM